MEWVRRPPLEIEISGDPEQLYRSPVMDSGGLHPSRGEWGAHLVYGKWGGARETSRADTRWVDCVMAPQCKVFLLAPPHLQKEGVRQGCNLFRETVGYLATPGKASFPVG